MATRQRDHVDQARAQWRAVRPDVDTQPAAIVSRISRLHLYFDDATAELMASHGVSRASWDILQSLRRQGPPYELTPTDLYRGLRRSSGWMTNRLNRLEEAGLVRRRDDPADGRGVIVRLTARGRKLVDRVIEEHVENERRLLAGLPKRERALLEALLRRLLLPLENETERTPRGRHDKSGQLI
jgi:DNA-binding MarR family transcriptional regulator